mmetsp:Transcript_34481/g.91016  ORF Transcript_34481/g.91016 Transcript_34481/m.91016 type:complete len:131 (-) Transcript_34481:454-846(-)
MQRGTRARLSEEDVAAIFELKMRADGAGSTLTAASVGRKYGVNEKTIRDIWKGRTWNRKTWLAGSFKGHESKLSIPSNTKAANILPNSAESKKVGQGLDSNAIDVLLFEWEQAAKSDLGSDREHLLLKNE